uniref:Uncharacterized protein n=1 Tax=Mustela putorius furo TaxID=9669 RepID=M3YPC1_MUSPF
REGALGEAGVGRRRAWGREEAQEVAEAGLRPAGTRDPARFLGSASEGSGQRRCAALATAASARSGRSPHGPQRRWPPPGPGAAFPPAHAPRAACAALTPFAPGAKCPLRRSTNVTQAKQANPIRAFWLSWNFSPSHPLKLPHTSSAEVT